MTGAEDWAVRSDLRGSMFCNPCGDRRAMCIYGQMVSVSSSQFPTGIIGSGNDNFTRAQFLQPAGTRPYPPWAWISGGKRDCFSQVPFSPHSSEDCGKGGAQGWVGGWFSWSCQPICLHNPDVLLEQHLQVDVWLILTQARWGKVIIFWYFGDRYYICKKTLGMWFEWYYLMWFSWLVVAISLFEKTSNWVSLNHKPSSCERAS